MNRAMNRSTATAARHRCAIILRGVLLAILLPWMAACSHHADTTPAAPENPYLVSSRSLAENGLAALRRERWAAAEQAFQQSLQAAELADDMPQVIVAWYRLGVLYRAMQRPQAAKTAYAESLRLAEAEQQPVMAMRAHLALLLLAATSEPTATADSEKLPDSLYNAPAWPLDIHLQAARLAQLRGDMTRAQRAYQMVIAAQSDTAADATAIAPLQARAQLGLAELARQRGQQSQAKQAAEAALTICHRIGEPRIAAHAHLLLAELAPDGSAMAIQGRQRALRIYRSLHDMRAEQRLLTQLLAQPGGALDAAQRQAYQLRLQQINAQQGAAQ